MLSQNLEQVKSDLERSRSWLAQVQSKLDPASATSFSDKPISTTQEATKNLPSSDRKKYYLSIGAIMKNEAPYLREWIEFHKIVGVERFYLYNNESTDNTVEVLQPYIRSGEVVLEHCRTSMRQVNNAYNHCLEYYGSESEWIAFIDIDEFLLPTNEDNLKTILDDYLEYPGLLVNWCCFGSSGHQTKPKGLTIENYTRCANSSMETSLIFKSIVQPSFVQACITSHSFLYFRKLKPVTENKIAFTQVGLRENTTLTSSWEKIRINHYIIRSREEFIAKRDRGDLIFNSERYTWKFFEKHDRNAVEEDLTIQRFLPQLKQNLQNL
jgi:Glycosyltransferase family 92